MNPPRPLVALGLGLCALAPSANARSVSVNLTPWPTVDAQVVDPDENSITGLPVAEPVGGDRWNHIDLRGAGSAGTPTVFTAATQGGNHLDLIDSTGSDAGIDLTSSGSFYANFANVSSPNQSSTGDAGVMQGFLNLSDTESITLSGLNSWAPDGYQVVAVFDIGPVTRSYAITVSDGSLTQTYWTADTAGTDADPENDGTMQWIETTATGQATAVTDANHAVYGTFTGDTLTLSGSNNGGRATLNGFQIVALDAPAPAALNLNFGITLDDANAVDADESSVTGLPGAATYAGTGWNNILLRSSGFGTPGAFTAATQDGNHIELVDGAGSNSGVTLTSTGSFYSNFGGVTTPDASLSGDAALMQSLLLLDDSESLDLSGLSTWAPNGYRVRAFFDIGPTTRTYGLTMNDGTTAQTLWTADTAGTDADPDNDGAMNWIETTATTEATAVADANHAEFGPFTGDSLAIAGNGTSGRAALSGLQIIPLDEPTATIASFTATPDSFIAGETVTLAWDVADADSVSISPDVGTVSATGTLDLTPAETTTWTLTAARGGTQVTAQATARLGQGPITVYLLSGQSNMQGIAQSSYLPPELGNIPEILLFRSGQWIATQPTSGTFGPEIGIADQLRDLCPGEPIALLKYPTSGTSLELNWRPGADAGDTANWGNSFTGFVNTVHNGINKLEQAGWEPVIHGMAWQQGEQDAKDGLNVPESDTSADDYGANLSHFIGRVREQFASHAAPGGIRFVAGQVLPYQPPGGDVEARFPGRALVRQAILDMDEASGAPLSVANAEAIPTNPVDHPTLSQDGDGHRDFDEVHLNHVAQLNLGRSMAYALLALKPLGYADWAIARGVTGGPQDDDDLDGLTNRYEYETGGDPLSPEDAPRPTLDWETIDGEVHATISIQRNLEALEGDLQALFSPDLADWSSLPPEFLSSTKNGNGTSLLRFRSPVPLEASEDSRGFFRFSHPSP